MREVSRHLFIPRRPLIASMLSSDPERNWIRIVKASLISSMRPALTSATAPFAMTRRFPLPARRSFASIDRVMGSISGLWLPPPASSAAAIFARFSQIVDPIGRNGYPFDNVQDEAFHLDGRRGEPSLGKRESIAQGRIKGASLKIERRERITDVGP